MTVRSIKPECKLTGKLMILGILALYPQVYNCFTDMLEDASGTNAPMVEGRINVRFRRLQPDEDRSLATCNVLVMEYCDRWAVLAHQCTAGFKRPYQSGHQLKPAWAWLHDVYRPCTLPCLPASCADAVPLCSLQGIFETCNEEGRLPQAPRQHQCCS